MKREISKKEQVIGIVKKGGCTGDDTLSFRTFFNLICTFIQSWDDNINGSKKPIKAFLNFCNRLVNKGLYDVIDL